ncbi:hypothetical protein BZG83_14635 [Salinivibrio sp. PR919]|nr:hypothetical protein BZG83_14635 [Salinivibrio sp. PR919]
MGFFRIPYSVFRIPYSVFRIPYSVFRIPYSVFRIPYSIFLHLSLGSRTLGPSPLQLPIEDSHFWQKAVPRP